MINNLMMEITKKPKVPARRSISPIHRYKPGRWGRDTLGGDNLV